MKDSTSGNTAEFAANVAVPSGDNPAILEMS